MNKLLLITGDMAAGKSTFSHMLGERYGLPVFNKDTLKEVMSNTLPFTDREDNLRLSHAAIDLLLFLFEQLTPLHTSLILEANFHGGEMERFRTLAEEKGYQLMILALQGDLPTLHKRYLHRTNSGQRTAAPRPPERQAGGLPQLLCLHGKGTCPPPRGCPPCGRHHLLLPVRPHPPAHPGHLLPLLTPPPWTPSSSPDFPATPPPIGGVFVRKKGRNSVPIGCTAGASPALQNIKQGR